MNDHFEKALVNTEELTNPVFITGPARSGTSLLARMVSLAEPLVYLPEMHMFSYLYYEEAPVWQGFKTAVETDGLFNGRNSWPYAMARRIKDGVRGYDRLHADVTRAVRCTKTGKVYDLRPSDVDHPQLTEKEEHYVTQLCAKYRNIIKEDMGRFFRVFYEDCCILSGADRVLEKSPSQIFSLPLLRKVFPQADFVFTYRRDKKELLSSFRLLTKSMKFTREYSRLVRKIDCLLAKESRRTQRFKIVPYEDVLETPHDMIQSVFDFLQLTVPAPLKEGLNDIRPQSSKFGKLPPDEQAIIERLVRKNLTSVF